MAAPSSNSKHHPVKPKKENKNPKIDGTPVCGRSSFQIDHYSGKSETSHFSSCLMTDDRAQADGYSKAHKEQLLH